MEVLLAAPGTGKTTKIKKIIDDKYKDAKNILVLSFTNATINDLNLSFRGYRNVNCYTLHKYSLLINHLPLNHILMELEILHLQRFSEKIRIGFAELCGLLGCMTFEMMISESISFIESNPAYAKEKIGEIDLIVVDEFQDFNELERGLLSLIFRYTKDIIVLGDDDQSIYSFKNADPEALIALYNDTSNIKIGHDHICYRCPDKIVDCCTTLISNNTIRVIKEWHKCKKDGELIVLQGRTHAQICSNIIDQIHEIQKSTERESILILCSQKIAAYPIVNALKEKGVEYVDFLKKDIDKQDFYLIWWLRAIYGKHQLLNTIFLICHYKLYSKIKLIEKFKDYFKDTSKLKELLDLIVSYSTLFSEKSKYLLNAPDINEFFKENPDFERFKENINPDDLRSSIEDIVKNSFKPVVFDPTKVNIMTIHKSKGLQADNVFIVGLNEGLLPNRSEGTDNLEAQRRLLYVGMTRAKKRLCLLSCIQWETKDILSSGADRTQFKFIRREIMTGKMSSFIHEMKLPVSAI